MQSGEDKKKLLAEFTSLLSQMEDEAAKDKAAEAEQETILRKGSAMAKPGEPGQPAPETKAPPEEIIVRLNLSDTFTVYEELTLPDGRILRRYDTGAVRVENPKSGVIQEERLDGSLVVSLPSGTVVFQEFRGDPLLVYNVDRRRPPGLARVSSATLPGETSSKYVFFFQDHDGTHLIELGTLRYYRIRT